MTVPDVPIAIGEAAPVTGHPRVDEALRDLATVGDTAPDAMIAALMEADRVLRETLDTVEDD